MATFDGLIHGGRLVLGEGEACTRGGRLVLGGGRLMVGGLWYVQLVLLPR